MKTKTLKEEIRERFENNTELPYINNSEQMLSFLDSVVDIVLDAAIEQVVKLDSSEEKEYNFTNGRKNGWNHASIQTLKNITHLKD